MLWMVRFLNDDGSPNGNYSIVQAYNQRDLFWLIDEFGDPRSCEIAPLKDFFSLNFTVDFKPDNDVFELNDFEAGFSLVDMLIDSEESKGFAKKFRDPEFASLDKLSYNEKGDAYA